MFPHRRQTIGINGLRHCQNWLYRSLRIAVPCLVAYAMAAHLILLAFATTAMATMGPAIMVAAPGNAQAAVRLAMVLCRPGGAWTDAFDSPENTAPDDAHARLCCGICALQGAGLSGRTGDSGLLTPQWRSARTPVPLREAPRIATPRLLPPVRGPPAGRQPVHEGPQRHQAGEWTPFSPAD